MQKKLIALAVAGLVSAPVFAQSNVQIYGIVDMGVFSKEDAAGNSVARIDHNAWSTSRLGFRGTEDLGNGLKAIFQFETQIIPENGPTTSNFGNARDTYVGLAGGFGQLRLGNNSTPLNNWAGNYDHSGVANAFRAFNVNLKGSLETRVGSSAVYMSPNMGGVTIAALYAPDENDNVKNDIYGVGAQYMNGPISAMYTYHAIHDVVENHVVGLAYDFGVAKAMVNYVYNEFEGVGVLGGNGSENEEAWGVGLSAPVGAAGKVSLGYTAQQDINGIAGADTDVWALTYGHNLSKRTMAYAGFQQQDPDNGQKKDTYGVGIRHTF